MSNRANREMRVVIVIFGSLFALLVVVGLAVLALGSHVANSIVRAEDPQAMERIAKKVATFVVPPGYRIGSATDIGMQQTVTLVPESPDRRGFTLQLQRSTLGSDPKATADGLTFALGLAARVVRCDPHDSIDPVVLAHRTLDLQAISCIGATRALRVETGVFPVDGHDLTIIASGLGGDFDRNALIALLRSIR